MTEHTPGPWEQEINEKGEVWVIAGNGHRYYIGDMELTCGECHANARLIAAAPDLLDALKQLVTRVDERYTGADYEKDAPMARAVTKAYATIALVEEIANAREDTDE